MSHGVDAEGLMSYIHDLYTARKRNQIRSIMTSIALLCGDLDEYVDAMVQQVNETEVSTEDCLSDHVQHYDSKEAVIENAEKRVSRLEKEKAETKAAKKSIHDRLGEKKQQSAAKKAEKAVDKAVKKDKGQEL